MACTIKAIHTNLSKTYSSTSGGSKDERKIDAISKETRIDTHPC